MLEKDKKWWAKEGLLCQYFLNLQLSLHSAYLHS